MALREDIRRNISALPRLSGELVYSLGMLSILSQSNPEAYSQKCRWGWPQSWTQSSN